MHILNLIFPKSEVKRPILCNLAQDFNISYTITSASISKDQEGLMIVKIEGPQAEEAIDNLKANGIIVSNFETSPQAD